MQIQKTNNIKLLKVHMAVIGFSGSGKTYLTSTIPGKPLILNADKGTLSLKKFKIDMVRAESWDDIVDFMKFIGSKKFTEMGYTCVVIDSFSAVAQIVKEYLESKNVTGFDFWGQYEKMIGSMMRTLRDSITYDSLSIFEVVEKENSSGLMEKRFGLQGSLSSKVPYFYDFVFVSRRIEKNNKPTVYALQTCKKDGWDFCKARGVELADFEAASIKNILTKLKKA